LEGYRNTVGDKSRLKLIRIANRSYMAEFLNPSLPSRVSWKNLNDELDSGPIFSPNELNTFYSAEVVKDFPNLITSFSPLFHYVMWKRPLGQ
jgi:hypothetical protein